MGAEFEKDGGEGLKIDKNRERDTEGFRTLGQAEGRMRLVVGLLLLGRVGLAGWRSQGRHICTDG